MQKMLEYSSGTRFVVMAPINLPEGRTMEQQLKAYMQEGYARIYVHQNLSVPDATAAMGGQYSLTATDPETGCSNSNSVTVTVNPPPAAPVLTHVNNTSCLGAPNGSVTVSGPTGAGFSYAINGGEPQSSPTFSGLAADTYSVTVTDGNGCTSSGTETVETEGNTVVQPAVTGETTPRASSRA